MQKGKNRCLRTVLIAGVTTVLTIAILLTGWNLWLKKIQQTGRVDLELDQELSLDSQFTQLQKELREQDLNVVFWKRQDHVAVSNPEFARTEEAEVMGITGDSSILFPGSNVLSAGEQGYCILGKELARKLFGSAKINGETVQIGDQSYQVAGIQYQEENLCVYEVSEDEMVENVSFYNEDSFQRGIMKQKLSSILMQE